MLKPMSPEQREIAKKLSLSSLRVIAGETLLDPKKRGQIFKLFDSESLMSIASAASDAAAMAKHREEEALRKDQQLKDTVQNNINELLGHLKSQGLSISKDDIKNVFMDVLSSNFKKQPKSKASVDVEPVATKVNAELEGQVGYGAAEQKS